MVFKYRICSATTLLAAALTPLLAGCGSKAQTEVAASAKHARLQSLPSTIENLPHPLALEAIDPSGDQYDVIDENPFVPAQTNPLSTFSIDVDTASYSKVRSYLFDHHELPRPDAVRIEELINYFDYGYSAPTEDTDSPLAIHAAMTQCPWQPNHRLARIALQGKRLHKDQVPQRNLVFLIDVSGSMNAPNKLPLLKKSMELLLRQLDRDDRLSLVVYAGAAGVVLDGATGDEPERIAMALDNLAAGGSTNGGDGIMLAYRLARQHFIEAGDNRVILCTDGDFNVGATGTDSLVRLVEEQASSRVYLTVLGVGMGNHNDAMLEQISGRGNGNYFFIDSLLEAEKVLVHDLHGTLTTIAKDVKIQVEFNPQHIAAYRLIGYENRLLQTSDFNDDRKDAGEVGAGHRVTALYEIVPKDVPLPAEVAATDPLRYQTSEELTPTSPLSAEWLLVKVRYKRPQADQSEKIEAIISDAGSDFSAADSDYRFAAAVASFGLMLRGSNYRGSLTWDDVLEMAETAQGDDQHGFRREFCELVRTAKLLQRP